MIGGVERKITTRAGELAIQVAVRAIRQQWPKAVFENGDTGERYARFWDIPFQDLKEIFVYRDTVAADDWDSKGAIPELSNSMIHLIADTGLITVVVDELNAAMSEIVDGIASALGDEIHSWSIELEAA